MGLAVYSRRSIGYKAGMILLYFGMVSFIMAFASPFWYRVNAGLFYIHGGLWQNCVQALLLRMCASTPMGSMSSTWMCIVQSLQCGGVIGLSIACIYGVVVNWVQRRPAHTRMLEMVAALASILGLAGAVLFIIETDGSSTELKKLISSVRIKVSFRHSIGWALGLNIGSSILCLVASVIIALHNSGIPPEDVPEGIGYTDPETGAIVYPMVDTGSHEVFYIPPPPMPMSDGFQPMACPFQPPAYETVAMTPSQAPPFYTPRDIAK